MKSRKRLAGKTGSKAVVASKAIAYPSGVTWSYALPGTRFNFEREVKDGLGSSVLVPVLCWLMRNVPEAPLVVEQLTDDQWQIDQKHALPTLVRRPNPFYSGRTLWEATIMDYSFGEAFWIKNRNGLGELAELYWAPRALMCPKLEIPGDIESLYYEYTVGGDRKKYAPTDVVHFRFGMDPKNPLRGFSPLNALFREIYVDDQAANFAAAILRNLGIIGMVFSPKTGGPAIPGGKLEDFKKYVQDNFTGDKRGQAMAFSNPMDVQMLAYNLQGFDVGPIRDVSEERVTATVGVPAAVVGFGTGLQQTKVGATMREMIQLAWRQACMPMQRDFGEELDRSLLPEYQKNLGMFRVLFDTSRVFALWEDVGDRHKRVRDDFAGRLIDLAEARREIGLPVDKSHQDVWAHSTTMVITDENGAVLGPPAVTAPAVQPTAPGEEPKALPTGDGTSEEPTDAAA